MTASRLATWIGIGGVLLAGCATAAPIFEKDFNSAYQGLEYRNDSPFHGEWMQLAATRYGCDTMPLRTAVRDTYSYRLGLPPCEIIAAIPPIELRAFKTPTGIREEWRFKTGSQTYTVVLEGVDPRSLKTSFVQW